MSDLDPSRLHATPDDATAERERRNAEHGVRRLEAFSDGVFAIAATLLVLDLTISELGSVASDADLWAALGAQLPTVVAFVVSFLLLCLLWWLHTRDLDDVVSVDGVYMALNSLRLLGVVLIPFTTSLSSTFVELETSAVYLAANFCAVVLIGAVQAWYATDARRGLMPDLSEAERRTIRRGGLSAVLLSITAVVLSPFLGTLAFIVYAFDPLLTRLLTSGADARRASTE